MRIDLTCVSKKQIMSIKVVLLQYAYIKESFANYGKPNFEEDDFKEVFTDFYLSSQGKMRRKENNDPFFDTMYKCKPHRDLPELVEYLYKTLPIKMYEFSFATKLLHTVNNDSPIYDSKVHKYLKYDRKIKFCDVNRKKDRNGNPTTKIDNIRYNWDLLIRWYNSFIPSEECRDWINWFNAQFPEYDYISTVKKIDTIIFACSGY